MNTVVIFMYVVWFVFNFSVAPTMKKLITARSSQTAHIPPYPSMYNRKLMHGLFTLPTRILTMATQNNQSASLSKSIGKLVEDGRHLIDDSAISEKTLTNAMVHIVKYAQSEVEKRGGTLKHVKHISVYDCQKYFEQNGGGPPANDANRNVCMRPDGGVLLATIAGREYPILAVEDKMQGTNDLLFAQGKRRQATGNAIERGGKNIRGAEMLFAGMPVFPYVLFAAGCDFHSSETIAKRLEMMNMGVANHYIPIEPDMDDARVSDYIAEHIIPNINIHNRWGKCIASIFVKAHKWDVMPHGASNWKEPDIIRICCKVIDLTLDELSSTPTPN